jgi:transposase
MPAPYDLDLREKAIAAVERGERKSNVARLFGISRNTLDLWLKRKAETGSAAAKTDFPRGTRPTIEDLEKFRAFVEENRHLTQKEMLDRWPQPVSISAFARTLRKIRFSRSKQG